MTGIGVGKLGMRTAIAAVAGLLLLACGAAPAQPGVFQGDSQEVAAVVLALLEEGDRQLPGLLSAQVDAPAQAGGGLSPEERQALVARGLEVYKAQYCGVCHQLDSAQTKGEFGPSHNGMGQVAAQRIDNADYAGSAQDVFAYLYESIIEPDAYLVEGYAMSPYRMPSYRHIPQEDLQALVVFLANQ